MFFNPLIHKANLKEDSVQLNFNSFTILLNSNGILPFNDKKYESFRHD